MKGFDENEHMACPQCGFEAVWVNPKDRTIALVLKDGTPDPETLEHDMDADEDDDTETYIMCNHNSCNWIEYEGDWMDGVMKSVNELFGVTGMTEEQLQAHKEADALREQAREAEQRGDLDTYRALVARIAQLDDIVGADFF